MFKQKQEGNVIYNGQSYGPTFGWGNDTCIMMYEPFQEAIYNCSNLGNPYVNDIGISGNQLFTGEYNFAVEEIEVFELI
jgi:hypothetical protein